METLGASSLKVFLENHRDKDRGLSSPTSKTAGFRVFGYQKYVSPLFSLSVSLRRKTIRPICSAPALSSSEAETCIQNEEIQTENMTIAQSKTVHVKFQLRRECSFGQQFLIVGDDPMFGLWDPSNAVPMNWSEGHVWTIELDMPCDKVIKYKLILKEGSNTITWQPGPDRLLQTWETSDTITVYEDWENAQLQTVIEEDPIAHQLTQSIDNSEVLIVSEKPTITNGHPMLSKKAMAIVAENITGQNEEEDVATNGNSSPRSATSVGAINFQNNEITLDSSTGVPVLVPGLTPTAENEEESVTEVDKDIDAEESLGSGNVEEFSLPKLNLEEDCSIGLSISGEGTAMLLNDKPDQHDKGHIEKPKLVDHNDQLNNKEMGNDLLDNSIQWGRRTLQQFLMNLGVVK